MVNACNDMHNALLFTHTHTHARVVNGKTYHISVSGVCVPMCSMVCASAHITITSRQNANHFTDVEKPEWEMRVGKRMHKRLFHQVCTFCRRNTTERRTCSFSLPPPHTHTISLSLYPQSLISRCISTKINLLQFRLEYFRLINAHVDARARARYTHTHSKVMVGATWHRVSLMWFNSL